MTGTRRLARVAGLLYLIVALTAVFAELVRSRIVAPGDAAATADSIRASATLFRVVFVTALVPATIGEVAFVAWLLVKAVRVPATGSARLLTGTTS